MTLTDEVREAYATLTREGHVQRYVSHQELGETWRIEIRRQCRADKIRVRTYLFEGRDTWIVYAEIPGFQPSEEQIRERHELMRERMNRIDWGVG